MRKASGDGASELPEDDAEPFPRREGAVTRESDNGAAAFALAVVKFSAFLISCYQKSLPTQRLVAVNLGEVAGSEEEVEIRSLFEK
jgi:hypothetical protein